MYYVYLIKSIQFPKLIYVGYTTNLEYRLVTHNAGGSIYTAKHRPWTRIMYTAFADEPTAKNFEQYLKSHSGRAFAKKRFLKNSE